MLQYRGQDVTSAYSGERGCMCGCKGAHKYATEVAGFGKQLRGYDISADEVSDRAIKIIVGKLTVQDSFFPVDHDETYIAAEVGGRQLAAYFRATKISG